MGTHRLALTIKLVVRSRKDLRRRAASRRTGYVSRRNISTVSDSSTPPLPASPTHSPGGPQHAALPRIGVDDTAQHTGPDGQQLAAPGSPTGVVLGDPPMAVHGSPQRAAHGSPHVAGPGSPRLGVTDGPAGPPLEALVVNNNDAGGSCPQDQRVVAKSETTEDWSDSETESDPDVRGVAEPYTDCTCSECEDLRDEASRVRRVQNFSMCGCDECEILSGIDRDADRVHRQEEARKAAMEGNMVVDRDAAQCLDAVERNDDAGSSRIKKEDAATPTPSDLKGKNPIIDVSDDDEM